MRRFKKGDKVVCQRQAPAKGTWRLYDGKKGTVRVGLTQDGEVGVWLGQYTDQGNELIVWFLPTELALRTP